MTLSRLAVIAMMGGALVTACSKTEPAKTGTPQPTQTGRVASSTPDEFAVVRGIYAKDCASCHGDTGEGKTVEIEGKKIKAPALATGHALKHSDPDFVKQIAKGGEGMPAFEKKISATDIDEMVRFIRKVLQGGNQPAAKP
jgi:mono/diheme cytochrome c family protein